MDEGGVIAPVDHLAAGRKAFELQSAQGRDGACRYAAKIALEALAEGDVDAHAFWRSVERTLTLR